MRRVFLLLWCSLWLAPSVGAFQVFEDPGNTGVNPGVPLHAAPATTVDLNLYYSHAGTLGSAPCAGIGGGTELCGWDVRVTPTGATLNSFTPEPGQDIVSHIDSTSGVLRMNGGDPINGEGIVPFQRMGTLSVTVNGPTDQVNVTGNLFVSGSLLTQAVPGSALLVGDPCVSLGGDTDLDGVCDNNDNCPFAANPLQEDTGGFFANTSPDGIGNACQCGDINGNGQANSTDGTLIKRAAVGLAPYHSIPGTIPEIGNCDVNANGTCNSTDGTLIQRNAVGLAPCASGVAVVGGLCQGLTLTESQQCPNANP